MDMQNFFVECERLFDSSLNGIPLIIGGGRDRGTVVACSREAYRFGVRTSMPTAFALKLCPQARLLKGDHENYTKKSREVAEIIKDSTPLYERASIQSFYLDISGMDRFFGCFDWTKELSQNLFKHSGLDPTWALSVNKTVSKIGAIGTHPTHPMNIALNDVKPFLDPLPIQRLPQIGDTTFQLFSRIGIRSIGKLAGMPPLVVQSGRDQGEDHLATGERYRPGSRGAVLRKKGNLGGTRFRKGPDRPKCDQRNADGPCGAICVPAPDARVAYFKGHRKGQVQQSRYGDQTDQDSLHLAGPYPEKTGTRTVHKTLPPQDAIGTCGCPLLRSGTGLAPDRPFRGYRGTSGPLCRHGQDPEQVRGKGRRYLLCFLTI